MVFIGAAEPDVIKNAIRVPETYPSDEDRLPFNPKEVVRIRANAKFDDFYDIYGEPLGEGKFGKVFQCKERGTGLELAAKFIKIKKDADRKTVEREVSIMTQMRHPRIAQIYDAFYAGTDDVILLMEIVRGGELFNRVAEDNYVLTEKAVAMIVCQICEAIDYIHSQNIIHLDIKPENIMCVSETGNRIKLIDFGLAQHYDGSKDLYYMAGTPEFAAPEVIKYEPLDFRTDMWSVGVITYILLSGYSPFLGDNVAETYVNVERGEWEFTEEFDMVSETAKDFIRNLLSYNKTERMYPRECLKHPWIADSRAQAAVDTLLEQPIADGPPLPTTNLKRYIVRRRFRKLAFAVMCYVDFRNILNDLRSRKSETGEAFFAAAHVPEATKGGFMGALLAKSRQLNAAEEISEREDKPKEEPSGSEDMEKETTKTEEKPKKKKKQTTTTSSGAAERPRVKKPKNETDDEASVALPSSEESKEKSVQKKRATKEATAMNASSQEKPAKIKKNGTAELKADSPLRTKSPSPNDVPIIYEEQVKSDDKLKKKAVKPASSDSGVVVERKMKSSGSFDRSRDDDTPSEMTLSPPGTVDQKTKKKTRPKSASTSTQPSEEVKSAKNKEEKDSEEEQPKSIVATRLAALSAGDITPLKPPAINVLPPTPSTAQSKTDDKKGPLSVKIPSPSTSDVAPSSSKTSPSTADPPKRKKSEGKRVWKQEKYNAGEKNESRQSTEVIAVPKDELPPTIEAERAALVKRKAALSPLAERIAKMENMAAEKEKEQAEKRSRLKVEREHSSASESQSSSFSKLLPVITEKSSTKTTTTTTTVKQKKEQKDTGLVTSTKSTRLEVSEKSEKDTRSIKISKYESQEEKSADADSKKTTKKTTVKKENTTIGLKKSRSEESETSGKASLILSASKKQELELKEKTTTNGVTGKDIELKLALETKKKAKLDVAKDEKVKGVLQEQEIHSVEARDKEKKVKKKLVTKKQTSADDELSVCEVTPIKKKVKKPKPTKEASPELVEYPAGLASDIRMFKEARAKAKRKEEEQQRHVRFADDSHHTPQPEQSSPVGRSSKLERSTSEDARKSEQPPKPRRKSSYFEITDDDEETLNSTREDFSFSSLRQRLEKQLIKKNVSDEEVEEPKKELIKCPSTSSLLHKWKSFEKTNQ